jgi:hypothetical protein
VVRPRVRVAGIGRIQKRQTKRSFPSKQAGLQDVTGEGLIGDESERDLGQHISAATSRSTVKNQQQPRFDGWHSTERTERFPSNTHAAYVDREGGGARDMWGVEAAEDEDEDEADCK